MPVFLDANPHAISKKPKPSGYDMNCGKLDSHYEESMFDTDYSPKAYYPGKAPSAITDTWASVTSHRVRHDPVVCHFCQKAHDETYLGPKRNPPCRNCGLVHPDLGPKVYSATCVLIAARSHHSRNRHRSDYSSTVTAWAPREVQQLPMCPLQREVYGDLMWSYFSDIKNENEADRERFIQSPGQSGCIDRKNAAETRGTLRDTTPLIWLRWRSCDGVNQGQTRSEANWLKIWRSLAHVEVGGQLKPVGWITLCPLNDPEKETKSNIWP